MQSSIQALRKVNSIFFVDLISLKLAKAFVKTLEQVQKSLAFVTSVNIIEVISKLCVGLEISSNQWRMDFDAFAIFGVYVSICEFGLIEIAFKSLLVVMSLHCLVAKLKDVYVMQIIEVLSIETAESNHATTNESSTMPPAWLRMLRRSSSDLNVFKRIILDINDQQIVKIITKSTCKDINFIIVNNTRMPPSWQKRWAL